MVQHSGCYTGNFRSTRKSDATPFTAGTTSELGNSQHLVSFGTTEPHWEQVPVSLEDTMGLK